MQAERVKAWVKLSDDFPWWPCRLILQHPTTAENPHLSYEAAFLRKKTTVFVTTSAQKIFNDRKGNYLIDKVDYDDGELLVIRKKTSEVKPFFENFKTNYRAVMDDDMRDKWGGDMKEHFSDCLMTLVNDNSIGLQALLFHFSLLNSPPTLILPP